MARSNYKAFKRIHMQGNLVRTTARVGNISEYTVKASTEKTPYLISTYKRYVALEAERKQVVDRVTGKYKSKYGNAVYALAGAIAAEETKQLNKVADSLGLSDAEALISAINHTKHGSGNKTMKQIIDETTNSFAEVFYYFQVGDYKKLAPTIAAAFGVPTNDIDLGEFGAKGGAPRYLTDTPDLVAFNKAFDSMIDMLSAPDMFKSDMLALEVTLSMMHDTLIRAKNKLGKSNTQALIGETQYQGMLNKLNAAKSKLESDLTSAYGNTIMLKYKKSYFGVGLMTEVITNQLLGEGLLKIAKNNRVDGRNVSALEKATEEFVGTTIESIGVGGKSPSMKTVDLMIKILGKEELSLTADVKWSGKKAMEKRGAKAMYQAPSPINFGEEFINLMNDNSSDSVARLYRSMVLNLVTQENYMIGPAERTMLLAYKLSKRESFDRKFKLQDGTFPLLVVSNGYVVRFSDAVRKMGESLLLENQTDMAKGSWGNKFSYNKDIDHKALYREKINIGKGKSRPGFSERVPTAARLANDIESSYRELGTKHVMLRFKIK